MVRTLVAAAIVVALLVAGPAGAQAQVDSSFLARIPKAIDSGVKWLKEKQIKDGSEKGSWGWGENPLYPGGGGPPHRTEIGIAALALLALEVCEVDPNDPVIVEGWNYIHNNLDKAWKGAPGGKKMTNNYEAGVVLMAIEAHLENKHYFEHKVKKRDPKKRPQIKLTPEDDAHVRAIVAYLTKTQSTDGGWRYGMGFPAPLGVNEDVSATQVVLLGLNSASRMGVQADPEVFNAAARYTLRAQEKDGPPAKPAAGGDGRMTVVAGDKCRGWAYAFNSTDDREKMASGSMSACGIASLILCKAELLKAKKITPTMSKNIDRGVFDGLAWLDANWTVDNNPGGHRSHYYYLYGLERVGVLGNMEKIGPHNWYIEGAQVLIQQQQTNGMWYTKTEVEPGDVIDTCLALLFLKKATVPVGSIITR